MTEHNNKFLCVSPAELKESGIDRPDFVLVTGDAYVDHPSFGAAVIGRVLEAAGWSVGIIAQPNWKSKEAFTVFGEPRLGFLVTSGNIDSMVNNYTVAKKPRSVDSYSPGGKTGSRPDRAAIVYSNKIRETYKTVPIILGGLEASLRRLAHYDYWDDKLRRSILLDSGADFIVYGMGEHQITEIADILDSEGSGFNNETQFSRIHSVRGIVYKTKNLQIPGDYITLPNFTQICASKEEYARSFNIQYLNTDHINAKTLVEPYEGLFVVQNTPSPPLTREEMDKVHLLNYCRTYHPMYENNIESSPEKPAVPAISEVRFSIISNRGCFGACNFCALSFHQGRIVSSRSHESILDEAKLLTALPDFKGYIHDVGGPTANFRNPACSGQLRHGACKNRQCLFPSPCKKLTVSHSDYLSLLRKLRALPRVKKVFVRSGIRFDYLMADSSPEFFKELVKFHISGQLKVAPEPVSAKVLDKMGKPGVRVYEKFVERFQRLNSDAGMNQFLVPYFISSHPGCDLTAAIELAEFIRDSSVIPEQVQDFYPTPGTLSTCMYYTELDPRTMERVYVPKSPHEKAMQRALMQYRLPQNRALVTEALKTAGRTDLIGYDKNCLIRPNASVKPDLRKKTETAPKPLKKRKTIRNVHKKKK